MPLHLGEAVGSVLRVRVLWATVDRSGANAGPGALPRHGEVGGVRYILQEVREPWIPMPLCRTLLQDTRTGCHASAALLKVKKVNRTTCWWTLRASNWPVPALVNDHALLPCVKRHQGSRQRI